MSVTYPKGFSAAGVAAGLKKSGGKDVAVVVNTGERVAAAAVFTPNRFAAAPVQWSRQAIAASAARGAVPVAVVLNSGGANACTGATGQQHAARTARRAADALGLGDASEVLVCSTGLIGELLPIEAVCAGVERALVEAGPAAGGESAAEAILTTDTHPKTATAEATTGTGASMISTEASTIGAATDTQGAPTTRAATTESEGGAYRVGGMAKGAGMLAPALATMLVVVTTDAVLDNATAQAALAEACRTTFNRIDSDGCMSTNDTVILLASGASGAAPTPDEFTATLTTVCADLARQLIGDAEGASHDIRVEVVNAATEDGALEVARAIARSNLLKAAIFGNDPNWGRVLAAAGTVPPEVAAFDPDRVDVSINGVMVCLGGGVGADRGLVDLTPREVSIVVDLHAGDQAVTLWTNDLTHDYVHENSAYSS